MSPDADGQRRFSLRKLPGYTKSLLLVFVIPFLFLFRTILKNVQKKPFWIAVGLVCALGWFWSGFLSYKGWWEFPAESIIGIHVLPHLPLEEFIIYPLGGAFSIFFYTFPSVRWPKNNRANPLLYWGFLIGVTGVFAVLAYVKRDTHPWYLYSQFVLYNGLCLILAPFIAKDLYIPAVFYPMISLGAVGFFWDYFAFQLDWWIYHAITNVRVFNIPVEDFNFYLLAPPAAISLYVLFCKLFKLPPLPARS